MVDFLDSSGSNQIGLQSSEGFSHNHFPAIRASRSSFSSTTRDLLARTSARMNRPGRNLLLAPKGDNTRRFGFNLGLTNGCGAA
jgi:hypothetical protein